MNFIKRIALAGACLAALPLFGQASGQSAQSAQTILPDSVGTWTGANREALQPSPQPAAAAAREYGFVTGETVAYSRTRQADTLTADVYRMKDPTGAYGEYSYLRTPDMASADFTDHSAIKADEALVLIGNLVLDVRGANAQHDGADIKALVAAVKPKAEDGLLPTLPSHMPDEDRVAHSDHYILGPQTLDQLFPGGIGNSLGFSYGAEVETAHFRLDGHDATLLIADFPTPQIAQHQLTSLSEKFNVNGSQAAANAPALFATRSQTMIALLAGASSSDEANQLLDKVNAREALTWDQPTFQFKEPPFEVMVVGAFVGTGVICLLTIIGALVFGGFRLAIKRMFPNTIFDRNTQIDILQMGLVSKPIKAEDFYSFDGRKIDTGIVDKNLPDRTALRLFK